LLCAPSCNTIYNDVFLDELRKLGWVEGTNLVIARKDPDNRLDQLPALAADLVRSKPDLIVAVAAQAARAAKNATSHTNCNAVRRRSGRFGVCLKPCPSWRKHDWSHRAGRPLPEPDSKLIDSLLIPYPSRDAVCARTAALRGGPSSKLTFDPRCRGLCGSHKQASMLVANVNRPLSASSLSQSRCLNFQIANAFKADAVRHQHSSIN
jgi:hypothetical protein